MKVFLKTNLFMWFLNFETQQLKNYILIYSQYLIEILSKAIFFSSMEGVNVLIMFERLSFRVWSEYMY